MDYNKMELNQAIKKCVAVASKSDSDQLKYIKIKTVNNRIILTATDAVRLVSYEVDNIPESLNKNFEGLLYLKLDRELANKITDITKFIELPSFIVEDKKIIRAYPKMPVFKFVKYIEVEADPIRRFCRMQGNNNITLKITMGRLILSYKSKEVKTKVEADILKSNIGYFKTALNAKLLKSILPAGKTIKIKVGKSGREPLSFGGQIIMPLKTKTDDNK